MSSQSASTFFKLSSKEVMTDEWEVLDDPGRIDAADILSVIVGLLFFVVPGLIAICQIVARPRRKGFLCLTNWRCLYYEQGEGFFKNYHRIDTTDLPDIVAVHSDYEEGIFGVRSLVIRFHTRFEDSIEIRIGETGGVFAKIPGIGKLFQRNSIGRDALTVPPRLYRLVQERRNETANVSTNF